MLQVGSLGLDLQSTGGVARVSDGCGLATLSGLHGGCEHVGGSLAGGVVPVVSASCTCCCCPCWSPLPRLLSLEPEPLESDDLPWSDPEPELDLLLSLLLLLPLPLLSEWAYAFSCVVAAAEAALSRTIVAIIRAGSSLVVIP
jgi:hypothetical protein